MQFIISSLLALLSLREHFPKPHRDTRAEPFDARCCHGYWIKVSRFAEEIISQAARGQGCRPRTLFLFCAALVVLLQEATLARLRERNSCKYRVRLSFGFSRLVVFLCRQNGRRRHLALNIYGKVSHFILRNGETFRPID